MTREGECLRCGKCCQSVYLTVTLAENATEEERKKNDDVLTWASLHEDVVVQKVDEHTNLVGMDRPCRFLAFDDEGKATCLMYENRPEICRRFPEKPTEHCKGFRFT